MKLLSKSEVSKAKAADRQAEIAEGMKLAKRVDGLREVAAQEEASLTNFRNKTLEEITREAKEAEQKRDTLLKEVVELQEQRALALRPLTEENSRIEEKRKEIADAEDRLAKLNKELIEERDRIDNRIRELAQIEERTITTHTQVTQHLQESVTLKGDSERKNRLADEVLQNAQREATILIENATQQAIGVKAREEAVFAKEEELRTREIELAKGWSLLRDRQSIKSK